MKNKLKIHNYEILNYKYSAKKTTGQWTYIYGQGDQRVKVAHSARIQRSVRSGDYKGQAVGKWLLTDLLVLKYHLISCITGFVICRGELSCMEIIPHRNSRSWSSELTW